MRHSRDSFGMSFRDPRARGPSQRGAVLEGSRVPLARILRPEAEEAACWRDDLIQAIAHEDEVAIERAWSNGKGRALWRPLGFESIESFCIAVLDMTAGELIGLLPTEDLEPQR
jgi:hypothetical protein